ncbi:hypothetical protein [Tropicimonas marinistellae]|uniref:hypothetical protein n=1 Tax=Tropicimonas marinistellae TaxID=1739787 RepID=UPI00082D60E6|nr:hypothetical protein [Tropicimonas marinistellae]
MIAIGSRPLTEAVGGLQSATPNDRRIAPITKTAPTSRMEEYASVTSQTVETQQLGALAVQPVPEDGPSETARTQHEVERSVAIVSASATGDADGELPDTIDKLRAPVPPLKQIVEIPTETTEEILRLREEAQLAAEETAQGTGQGANTASAEVGASIDTLRQIQAAVAPTVDLHR